MTNKNIIKLQKAGNIPSLTFNSPKIGSVEWLGTLRNYDPNWRTRMLAQLNENMSNVVPFSEDEQETDAAIQEEAPTLSQINTTYVNTPRFEIDARERAKTNAIQQHDEWLEQYRSTPNVNIPEWFSLLWNTAPKENVAKGFPALQKNAPINSIAKTSLQKLYTDYGKNLYEEKYNEYLNQHPIKSGTGVGYDQYIGMKYNPLVQRQKAAHNYAIKQSGYIGDHSTVPYEEADKNFENISVGLASMIPLIGASFGAFGTLPKIAADIKFGYDGAKNLLSSEGALKTWNFIKQGRYGRALRSGAWDLLDLGLARQGIHGIKSFGNYAKDVANVAKFNIWNRPNKFRMEYPWQRMPETLPSVMETSTKTQPSFVLSKPLSIAYKQGGVIKNQIGGLVYKPFVQDTSSLFENPTTISYEPEESNDESFRVEPVRIYNQKTKYKQEATVEPIQEQDIEPMAENSSTGFTDEEKRVLFNDGTNEEKRKISIKYLQQQLDLTKEQAAAIVGQWQRESHFRLNAENKDEKAGKNSSVKSSQYGIGIGQWTGSRHDAFIKYVNEHGGKTNLKTQLDFAIREIKSNPSFLNNLRKATSIQDASAYTFVQYVGAQYKTIKDIEDLYSKVNNTVAAYRKKHNEMYGRSSNMFDIGLKNAIESLNLS